MHYKIPHKLLLCLYTNIKNTLLHFFISILSSNLHEIHISTINNDVHYFVIISNIVRRNLKPLILYSYKII